nr:MAG TPA: hypothetical protein [Bacteriophage sp.]
MFFHAHVYPCEKITKKPCECYLARLIKTICVNDTMPLFLQE